MIIAIDTGPLSAFAEAGRLAVLEMAFAGAECVYPPAVDRELSARPSNHSLVANTRWLKIAHLTDGEELDATSIKARIGGKPWQNLGESECLAIVKSRGGAALIDDSLKGRDPTQLTRSTTEIVKLRSLGILLRLVHRSQLSRHDAVATVDGLLATGYHLPVTCGEELFQQF